MVLLMVASSIFGQVPASFKYQAVLRDARGNIKANIATQLTISVLTEDANGTAVFSETHSASTDGYGLINLEIGKGTPTVGTLSDIDWGASTYFIKVDVDGVEMGTSQLLSVPYALYAKTAGNVTGNITETDPVFTDSQAAIITANHITKLNNLSGVNTGDQNLSGLATTTLLTSALGNKVDKVAGKGLSANDYTNAEKTKLMAITCINTGDQNITAMTHSNRAALDAVTGKNTGDQDLSGLATTTSLTTSLSNKVDKVAGKGLSTADFTTAEKTKLAAITGSNTGYQDITAMTHSNRAVLDSVSGKNTGDQDLTSVLVKGPDAWNKKIVNVNQLGVGTDTPDLSSAIEIKSTTQGFLPPRMTYVQKLAIISPASGLIIWCNNCGVSGEIQVYNGKMWTNLIGGSVTASLPIISLTTKVYSITKTTATSGGNVTSDGGATLTLRGVCWSTKVNPTVALSTKTIDGTGTGVFSSSLTGLSADSTYYVRAYATNSAGTDYGSSITFTTISNHVAPTITTTAATNITQTTATSGGNVTSDGGATITVRGICWSTSVNPTIALKTKTTNGTGTGIFSSSLTGLSADSTYYVRAYATNSAGTDYGSSITFTTISNHVAPTITTTAATNIAQTTATSGGNVTSDGGATITSRGVCWSTASNPTVALSTKTSDGIGSGVFSSSLTGLTAGTNYYIRAYATNSTGTAYGPELSFKTSIANSGTTVTDIDGNVYHTVTIGTQVWMVENLKTIKYRNGDPIPNITNSNSWAALNTGAYCWYNNDLANKADYGALYNWYSVADIRNIAPTGWHVATYDEWTTLINFLGGDKIAGDKVTEKGIVHWQSPNSEATNESGFTALPGGACNYEGAFNSLKYIGYFWSSTEKDSNNAMGKALWCNQTTFINGGGNPPKSDGFSVRCVKDADPIIAFMPTLNTAISSSITAISASSGGNISSDGGASISARGVCWSTAVNPTNALSTKTSNGTGTGVFSSALTGLTAGTTYYVRAYATNSAGTSYGNSLTFTTLANPVIPTLTTTAATNIAQTTATGGGNVTSDGGATITSRGVCWSTAVNPTIALSTKTSNGTGSGLFSSSLTGLSAGSTYYVRAYATNSIGTSYGSSITFNTTTNYVVPTLTTTAITNVAQTTAASGGNVTSDGGTTITSRGVCWSISANPTVSLNVKTTDGIGTGSFTSNLNGLTSNTSYYLRAYATNSTGTGYGSEVKFSTATSISGTVIDIDGNVYKTITIGRQVWMAENLKTTKYRNGDLIGTTTPATLDIEAENAPKYQWAYDENISNVDIYGRLYTWYAANDSRGACPTGWNLPSVNQVKELIISVDVTNSGYALKEAGTTHWNPSKQDPTNSLVTNSSGFTGLPAGGRMVNGTFDFMHETTALWTTETSTQEKVGYAHNLNSNTANNDFFTSTIIKNIGVSVRCLKDNITGSVVIPTLNTTTVSNIATTSASCGGNISSDGGATVTARGVCWSMSTNPTVALSTKTWDDYGTGIFTSSLAGLAAGTTYYVRAYSTNSVGTSYGTELSFATLANPVVPTLTTIATTNIAQATATSGGNVTADGGTAITARGVCWSTAVNPTVALNTKTSDGIGSGIFATKLTGLMSNNTYYLRAYATNSAGTAYGAELSFKTLITSDGTTVSDIDGNVYHTVTIGSQVWMVENLKTTKYRNGDPIPNVTVHETWISINTGAYCWYKNDAATFKATYGAIYNWFAVADNRNIAPVGWHVPTDVEWTTLTDFLGGQSVAGGKLKETGTSHWVSPNTGATNSSGFTALPGGTHDSYAAFYSEGEYGNWWSSTARDEWNAWYLRVEYRRDATTLNQYYKQNGWSVRCVKDVDPTNAVVPILNTTTISNIATTSAISGGNISNEGGASITARGVCWSTSANPTVALSTKTSDGTGTGVFSSTLTGLTAGTNYNVRAYATNSAGTSYGSSTTFITLANIVIPTLTTTAASNIDRTTAISGGNVTADGGASITSRGVCWSTAANPTIALSSKTSDGTGTGLFTSSITGLTAGTTYYARAYATNSAGTSYGNSITLVHLVAPTFTNAAVTNITQTTATTDENITADGGATIKARGVCWSTFANPFVTLSSKTIDGTGTGAFTSSLTGLTAGTTYYVRAYATNSVGTFYGSSSTFTTLADIVLPALTTAAVTSIIQTTATSGGNVTADGGAAITARGVCWSIQLNPTVALSTKTSNGTGTGVFSSSLTGLTAGTAYCVRAYATNINGTYYGSNLTFFVPESVSSLTTTAPINITPSLATSGGNVSFDGGTSILERGVCWSKSQNPTITNSKTSNGKGTGIFSSSLTGLTPGTTYYVKAYATNSVGTAYGVELSFKTSITNGGISVTDIDGNVYNTVTIGTQVWMVENLKTTKYRNGDPIPNVTDANEWYNSTTGAYQWYNNSEAKYKDIYGGLYNWYTVTDSRNIAPNGWHVPTNTEWTILAEFLGGSNLAGGKLKEAGTTYWDTPNINATNTSGFTALPGGEVSNIGSTYLIGCNGFWWSSTNSGTTSWDLCSSWSYLSRTNASKTCGYSVRCLKD